MEIDVPNCGLNAKALLLAAKIYNREYSTLDAMLSNPPDQFFSCFVISMYFLSWSAKRISKRGSVLQVRGGCYNYRFKLYK